MQITLKLYASLGDYLPLDRRRGNELPLELPTGTAVTDAIAPYGLPPEKYARQILGTVNYTLGDESFFGDVHDYLHGFLNYQSEHHLFPDLPPLAYKRMASKVEAICEKHVLPYRKEAVGTRIKRTLALMMGWTRMPREPYVPAVTMNEVFAE